MSNNEMNFLCGLDSAVPLEIGELFTLCFRNTEIGKGAITEIRNKLLYEDVGLCKKFEATTNSYFSDADNIIAEMNQEKGLFGLKINGNYKEYENTISYSIKHDYAKLLYFVFNIELKKEIQLKLGDKVEIITPSNNVFNAKITTLLSK